MADPDDLYDAIARFRDDPEAGLLTIIKQADGTFQVNRRLKGSDGFEIEHFDDPFSGLIEMATRPRNYSRRRHRSFV